MLRARAVTRPRPICVLGDSHVFAYSDRVVTGASGDPYLFRALYCPGLSIAGLVDANGELAEPVLGLLRAARLLTGRASQVEAMHRTRDRHWHWTTQLDGREGEEPALLIACGSIDYVPLSAAIDEDDVALSPAMLRDPTVPAEWKTAAPGALPAAEARRRIGLGLRPLRAALRRLTALGFTRLAVAELPPSTPDEAEMVRGVELAGLTLRERPDPTRFRYKFGLLVNAELEAICRAENVAFVACRTRLMDGDAVRPGTLRDFVHLAEPAARIVAQAAVDAFDRGGAARRQARRQDLFAPEPNGSHGVELDRLRSDPRYDSPKRLTRFGWRVFSQGDEDGIIHEIFARIGTTNRRFLEIGAGDGLENNTAYLLASGWSGTWIEADPARIRDILANAAPAIAEERLAVVGAAVTPENADDLIRDSGLGGEIDLLSLDIDGNDYHVLERLDAVRPRAVVLEYNASYRPPVRWIMRYDPSHRWDGTIHYGASLAAYEDLMRERGYLLVGCGLTGVNAFFVRADLAGDAFASPFDAETHFEPPRYQLIDELRTVSGHPPRAGPALRETG
ncbi:MAG TPA: hypothetical protein VGD01_07320 [Candidatus Elarobacter sp.]|jgi:hypothetical protein